MGSASEVTVCRGDPLAAYCGLLLVCYSGILDPLVTKVNNRRLDRRPSLQRHSAVGSQRDGAPITSSHPYPVVPGTAVRSAA